MFMTKLIMVGLAEVSILRSSIRKHCGLSRMLSYMISKLGRIELEGLQIVKESEKDFSYPQ